MIKKHSLNIVRWSNRSSVIKPIIKPFGLYWNPSPNRIWSSHITKRMVPYTLTISIFAWRALYKDIGKYSNVYASYRHFSKIPVVYGFRGIRMLQCKIICPWVGFFVFGFWNASPLRCHLHHILVSCHFQARYLIFTLLFWHYDFFYDNLNFLN